MRREGLTGMMTRFALVTLAISALWLAAPACVAGAEDTASLIQAIGAKDKTPDQKAQVVRAVVARMEQRAEELRAEVKKTPTAASIQSLKDLEGYVLNLKGTEYRQDRWNSTSSWAYYTKMLGGNTIFLCPPFFDDSYNVSGATPQDKQVLLDIWLGERAALLIHESVHMKQQYLFSSGDDEAWAATEEWLHVLNDAKIQQYEEIWKKAGVTFNSQILAECMRHLGGKSARKTQPHPKIDPMKVVWKDVREAAQFTPNASPDQSKFGYTFCHADPNTPNVAHQYGWCRTLEQGRTRVWLDANGNGKEDPGEVSEQPYWLWYMTQIDTRVTYCEEVPDAQGSNPQSMEYMKKFIAEAPSYRKVGVGEMGIAGMKAWESGGYTIYRGECKAVAGPLVVEVGVSTFFQAGPHFWPVGPAGLIATGDSRIAVLDPTATRLAAFHGRAAVDEAIGLAVESAADAAEVQRFAGANFYWDTRAFLPTSLAGYTCEFGWPKDKPNKDLVVRFAEPGVPQEPENYNVHIEAYAAGYEESWEMALARLGKRYADRISNLNSLQAWPNPNTRYRKGPYSLPGIEAGVLYASDTRVVTGKTETFVPHYETVLFRKSNVLVEINGYMPRHNQPQMKTQALATEIADKLERGKPAGTAPAAAKPK